MAVRKTTVWVCVCVLSYLSDTIVEGKHEWCGTPKSKLVEPRNERTCVFSPRVLCQTLIDVLDETCSLPLNCPASTESLHRRSAT